MMQQLKWWWDSFTDWADGVGDWITTNRFKLVMAMVILLAASSIISMMIEDDLVIQTRQVEDQVFMSWDSPKGGALIYEIQGKQANGHWKAVAFSPFPLYQVAIPEGALSFRVRYWTKQGPGRWSQPTETFFYSIPPDIFEEEEAHFIMGYLAQVVIQLQFA